MAEGARMVPSKARRMPVEHHYDAAGNQLDDAAGAVGKAL